MVGTKWSTVRFPHLNLWRNPFGELSPEERSQLALCDMGAEIQWLHNASEPGTRVLQFLGPCGHGKSSHLHYLSRHIANTAYLYIPPERIVPPWKHLSGWILVDEIDRAPWWVRRQMIRSRRVLAVGTHRDLASHFHRNGIETRTVSVSNLKDVSRVEQILNLRIQSSVFDRTRPAPCITRQEAEELVLKFGDDLRAIEDTLYEQYQTRSVL